VSDQDLVDLAMRVAAKAGPASETPEPPPQSAPELPPLPATPDSAFFPSLTSVKEKKTADELAAMIVADLREIEGCPKRGLKVAVYGSNPWNAWLSFGADAGPVPNKTELQDFLEIITERLKRLYDVPS
jgi:hypothetical protein